MAVVSAARRQLAKVREVLDRRDPAEMFDFFDTDKSGAIEFGEFTAMLPMLGIQMSDAKAFKQVSFSRLQFSDRVG